MTGYCVTVKVLVEDPSTHARGANDSVVGERLDKMMERLSDLHGSVGGDGRGWQATVTVEAIGLDLARERAVGAVLAAAHRAGLPLRPVVRVEVVREDVRDAELARPM